MLIVGNGLVITRDIVNPIISDGAVAIEGNRIISVGKLNELKERYSKYEFIDAKGKLIMPGYINMHMHYYSTFARGISNDSPVSHSLLDILNGLWWRLDRKLTKEDVLYSALVPMVDQIKNGVTTAFDHHASPYSIGGSLGIIAEAAERTGLRSNLSYEVSDRDGEAIALEGIKENVDFIKWCKEKNDDMIGGLFGLHASMTISDKTLDRCIDAAEGLDTGFHVHCAEGIQDVEDSRAKYNMGVIERWYRRGVLGNKTLAVHCVHVSEEEMDMIKESGAAVINNPESNMGNAVGAPKVLRMYEKGIPLGLGTDGYTTDMLESYKVGSTIQRHESGEPGAAWVELPKMMFYNNRDIARRYLKNDIGIIKPNAYADIIVVDYNPPTEITKDNIDSHLLFGVCGKQTDTTIINGKIIMKDRKLIGIDEEAIMAKSRELSKKLWERF